MDEHGIEWKETEHWKVVNSYKNAAQAITTTPEQIWELACNYFEWCDENPITAKRTLTSGKTQGEKVTVEFKRPYTVKGFCLHSRMSERYIKDMSESMTKESDWYIVIERILTIIYNQVLEGALVDVYNPIMASKLLNMDKEADPGSSVVRVEIVSATSNTLSNSENDVLKKLDFGKVESLKEKLEKE